jgi:hypothetical protein
LLFTFAGLTLLGNAAMLSAWQQVALLAAALAGMLLTAKAFSKSESKVERKSESIPTTSTARPQLARAPALPSRAEAHAQYSAVEGNTRPAESPLYSSDTTS